MMSKNINDVMREYLSLVEEASKILDSKTLSLMDIRKKQADEIDRAKIGILG